MCGCRWPRPPASPKGPRLPRPPRTAHPLRILLVEDDAATARVMQTLLGLDGHTTDAAGAVATALKLADQWAYDLLICDLGLPDGSGHNLLRELRERGHEFPGIALSGYGQEEDIRRSQQAGFAVHLTKPASHETLLEAIASATAEQQKTSN